MEFKKEIYNPARNLICIADDEVPIGDYLEFSLSNNFPKYRTEIFDDGKPLYDFIQSNSKNINLVITDNNMNEMNGLPVIKELSPLYPDINFILMSGYDKRTEALKSGAKEFIQKPFMFGNLEPILSKYLIK